MLGRRAVGEQPAALFQNDRIDIAQRRGLSAFLSLIFRCATSEAAWLGGNV